LSAVGVAGYFDFVAGYDSGHGAKPQAGQLLAFSAKVGVPSAQTAMVGDSTHDLSAARAAGMAAVGVLTGTASRADLSPLADVVLPDIGHLHGWLGDS
jgi:phosphoglycolate phosphatase